MKNDLTFKRTSLSTTDDVLNTLEYKMNSLQEQDLPIQEGLSDYIGLSLDEIEAQLQQLKAVKQEVSEREKVLKSHSQQIKEDGAKFLDQYGIEKMEGNIISSITITKGKPETSKVKFKLLVDKKASETYLVDGGLAVFESVEVPATKDVIRVNKRKVIVPEIEDENHIT